MLSAVSQKPAPVAAEIVSRKLLITPERTNPTGINPMFRGNKSENLTLDCNISPDYVVIVTDERKRNQLATTDPRPIASSQPAPGRNTLDFCVSLDPARRL